MGIRSDISGISNLVCFLKSVGFNYRRTIIAGLLKGSMLDKKEGYMEVETKSARFEKEGVITVTTPLASPHPAPHPGLTPL